MLAVDSKADISWNHFFTICSDADLLELSAMTPTSVEVFAPIFGDIPESPRQSGGFSVSPWFPVNTRQEVDKSLLLNDNNSPKNFRQKTESVRSVTQGHLPIFFAIIDSSVLSMAGFLLTI